MVFIFPFLLCDSMEHWIHHHHITPPLWNPPEELIMTTLTLAFESQKWIGWDQFFRGQLSLDWIKAITIYYCKQQPGSTFTPDHWMCTMIDAIWTFSMTLWHQRCASYHGINGLLTLEWKCKAKALHATEVYQQTIEQ